MHFTNHSQIFAIIINYTSTHIIMVNPDIIRVLNLLIMITNCSFYHQDISNSRSGTIRFHHSLQLIIIIHTVNLSISSGRRRGYHLPSWNYNRFQILSILQKFLCSTLVVAYCCASDIGKLWDLTTFSLTID